MIQLTISWSDKYTSTSLTIAYTNSTHAPHNDYRYSTDQPTRSYTDLRVQISPNASDSPPVASLNTSWKLVLHPRLGGEPVTAR
jgi:hypothetical protein